MQADLDEWIDVDRALPLPQPRPDNRYLVTTSKGRVCEAELIVPRPGALDWDPEAEWWAAGIRHAVEVTHWRPMPTPACQ